MSPSVPLVLFPSPVPLALFVATPSPYPLPVVMVHENETLEIELSAAAPGALFEVAVTAVQELKPENIPSRRQEKRIHQALHSWVRQQLPLRHRPPWLIPSAAGAHP